MEFNTTYIPNRQPGVDHYQVIPVGTQTSPEQTNYAVVLVLANGSWRFVDGRHEYTTKQSAHRRCRQLKQSSSLVIDLKYANQ